MNPSSHPFEKLALESQNLVKTLGAQESVISVSSSRSVEVDWRNGELERLQNRRHQSLGIELFVDGRYAGFSTNDLRLDPLKKFLTDAVSLTRLLEPDPCRFLPTLESRIDEVDLDLFDVSVQSMTQPQRNENIKTWSQLVAEHAAQVNPISYSANLSDGWSHHFRCLSSGFQETAHTTSCGYGARISLKDDEGRLPLGWAGTYARHQEDLEPLTEVAERAVARATTQLNPCSVATKKYSLVLTRDAVGKPLGALLKPLSGAALQQKRSIWKDRKGEKITSELLSLTDNPFVPRAFGSSLYDSDALPTESRSIIENGVLRTYLIGHYYAQKMGVSRTGSDLHNLSWKYGHHDQAGLCRQIGNGLLVERFLGGNFNNTTGDFSYGCSGRIIKNGEPGEAFSEANMSGQIEDFWKALKIVGNDPAPQSTNGAPSCAFDGIQISGD